MNSSRRLLLTICASAAALVLTGASYRTENFAVTAPTPEVARQVGQSAEHLRRTLAIDWLGGELPRWPSPCPIRVNDDSALPTTGRTSFTFRRGTAEDWEMLLSGPAPAVIDCVLPHEVMHTVLATHFGRPLPRWADEGTCTVVEHPDEIRRHQRHIASLIRQESTVSLSRLFATENYPRDPIPFYMQSYSVSSFLIERGGRQRFIRFVDDASRTGDWNAAVSGHYGLLNVAELEQAWLSSAKGLLVDASPAPTDEVLTAASFR